MTPPDPIETAVEFTFWLVWIGSVILILTGLIRAVSLS